MAAALLPAPADEVAALLREHPWPADFAAEPRLEWLFSYDLDAPRARVWALVSDMSRLNRALGNPEMVFEERGGERHGRGRYSGVLHTWHERPWEWVAGRWYRLVRDYARGSMKALYTIHTLDDLPGGRTRLRVYFGVVPRWRWITPGLRLSFGALGRAYRRLAPGLAAAPDAPVPPVFELPAPALRPEALGRLAAIEARLAAAPVDAASVRALTDFVRAGDELDLARIQVRERARAWTLDEDLLLRACLHATRAGLFELAWDVVCPHCRGVRDSEPHLAGLAASGRCDACDVTFGTADAVEVSFRVHASVREVTPRLFCSAEPARKAHIVMQRHVAPGATVEVPVELATGRYRLRRRGQVEPDGALDVGRRAASVALEATIAWHAGTPVGERAAAAGATLELVNDTATTQTFVLEEARPSDLALRPARLLSHPDFRDLFSDEYLATDVGLSVGEQTILFTDIVGSSAMYAASGDPDAFATVRAHFTKAFAVVSRHRGGVIKTIGDAVMAAFTDPVDAVRAAEELQRAFSGDAEPLRLRISLNTGPCIAVRLNANLDYFGNAVNLAAKLQAVAEAGQVALSTTTLAAPGVRELFEARAIALVAAEVAVKGLPSPVPAWRWDVW